MLKNDLFLDETGRNYEVQIIYTKVERKGKNSVKLTDYHYNVNKKRYFYPSTAVNLPAAALTLEKINSIAADADVGKDTYIKIDNPLTNKTVVAQDTTSDNKHASLAHYIKRMLLAGDKEAYNACYDFLDQRGFNERVHHLGFTDSWFLHKLNSDPPQNSRQTNIVTFFKTNMQTSYMDIRDLRRRPTAIPFFSLFVKKDEYNPNDYYSSRPPIVLGNKTLDDSVLQPVDFYCCNNFPIADMHGFLKMLIFPETRTHKLNLSADDYAFLFRYMSMAPTESENPKYPAELYPECCNSFIFSDKPNPSLIVFNNSGKGMGFLVENAYIVDTLNKTDFFLTVAIRCNNNQLFDEEHYEYDKVGLAFIQRLGYLMLNYSIQNKSNKPYEFRTILDNILK